MSHDSTKNAHDKSAILPQASLPSGAHETHLQTRIQRVLDYRSDALAKKDLLQANLGSINSGLMHLHLLIEEAVCGALAQTPSLDQLHKLGPIIEMHLRVARQIDRNVQLELRTTANSLTSNSLEAR